MNIKTKASIRDTANNLSYSTFSANVNLSYKQQFWTYDPLEVYLSPEKLRGLLFAEITKFSRKEDSMLRHAVALHKSFPKLPMFSPNKSDLYSSSEITNARDLRFVEAPVINLLYVASFVYSSDQALRLRFQQRISNFKSLPTEFLYPFNAIRQSNCGNIRITPLLRLEANNTFVSKNSMFKDTCFDFEYLKSDDGMDFIVYCLKIVMDSEMEFDRTDFSGSLPPLENTYITTVCSTFCTRSIDEFCTISLLGGNNISLDNPMLGKLVIQSSLLKPRFLDLEDNYVVQSGNPSFDVLHDSNLLSYFNVTTYEINTTPSGANKAMRSKTSRNKRLSKSPAPNYKNKNSSQDFNEKLELFDDYKDKNYEST